MEDAHRSPSPAARRLTDAYVRNAALIGALYVVVPTLGWFGWILGAAPFREVYALRLVLAVVGGGAIGACLNRYGLSLWILKHRSSAGPATVADGALIGGGVGFGCSCLPALTSFISTHHPELAKAFVLVAWAGGAALGALIGTLLAAVGRQTIDRQPPSA
jgi:hypothetical protein